MKKVPIAWIIDDPAPGISVYYTHAKTRFTKDGRPLIKYVPNELFFRFCDIVERHGLKGKFSVVPMPGNCGDIINGIEGVSKQDLAEWMQGLKTRVMPNFSIGPEMLTHNKAVDLATGEALEQTEQFWSFEQDRTTLTPYIAKAFSLLQEAGIDSCGVTSPWNFGELVEEEYVQSISQALYDVTGKKNAWYFCRGLPGVPNGRPWIALDEKERCVVSIPKTIAEHIWPTIDTPDTSEAYVNSVADQYITEDGTKGDILDALAIGAYPVMVTHWQSLMSNGLGTGLRVLDKVGERVNRHLSDRVQWMSFEEILQMVLENKEHYVCPEFKHKV